MASINVYDSMTAEENVTAGVGTMTIDDSVSIGEEISLWVGSVSSVETISIEESVTIVTWGTLCSDQISVEENIAFDIQCDVNTSDDVTLSTYTNRVRPNPTQQTYNEESRRATRYAGTI